MAQLKKINEIYVSKSLTLNVPYRGKIREISYMVTTISGTEFHIKAELRAKKYPCVIPNLQRITMELKNEFPTKAQLKSFKKHNP
jgi:hypothetical protein